MTQVYIKKHLSSKKKLYILDCGGFGAQRRFKHGIRRKWLSKIYIYREVLHYIFYILFGKYKFAKDFNKLYLIPVP